MSELPDGARAVVVTASNRAAFGVYEDTSGRALAEGLRELGFTVEGPHVRPDDAAELEIVLGQAIVGGADVVLTTGGTGLSPTDVTPEATRDILDRELLGIAEALRASGLAAGIIDAGLSRGLAGISGSTLVVNLAGSRYAVRDGMATLNPLVTKIIGQLSSLEI